MPLQRPHRRLWSILLVLLLVAACKKQASHSEMFVQIFKERGGTLRGVNLGMDLADVKRIEGVPPKHDDDWGYVFESNLGGKNRFFLEYLCLDPKVRKVDAIVLNVLLVEKAMAADLFAEMERDLRSKDGAADGNHGNLKWSHEVSNLLVTLRMLDDKKSISLNFGALKPL